MRTVNIEIPTESPCVNCDAPLSLELHQCPHCEANAYRKPFDEFFADLERKFIMDGRFGGLVLGRDTAEDDIPMFQHLGNNVFNLAGLMQGGEYLVCREATLEHRAELEAMNSEIGDDPDRIQMPDAPITTINTHLLPKYGGLWITQDQFIVNRHATAKHLLRLEELNQSATREALGVDEE